MVLEHQAGREAIEDEQTLSDRSVCPASVCERRSLDHTHTEIAFDNGAAKRSASTLLATVVPGTNLVTLCLSGIPQAGIHSDGRSASVLCRFSHISHSPRRDETTQEA